MPADLAPADRTALENIVRQLEAAWNAMDGSAFAAPFAADADFVNIRGEHFRGQASIAAGHAALFHRSRFSLVLTKEGGGWEIAALHNTLETAPGPAR